MVNKMTISELWSGDLGRKNERGEGLGALQFFVHLKPALELLISVRMNALATF